MWPFKKKKADENQKIDTLIAIRYTKEVWDELFPNAEKEWFKMNCPDNTEKFIAQSIAQYSTTEFKEIIIATLDNRYVNWLKNKKKKHSEKNAQLYINEHNLDEYWDDRLIESEMVSAYSVVGLPVSMLLHDVKARTSEYCIKKEVSEKLEKYLGDIYKTEMIYVPGWIMKNVDFIPCRSDIIKCAEIYWNNNMRVRYGKYMEQKYQENELKDLFSPFAFIIPFVIKNKFTQAKIDLLDMEIKETNTNIGAITSLQFTKTQKLEMLELLIQEIPQIISVANKSVLPVESLFAHKFFDNKI